MLLFAYGSLCHPREASAALGRTVTPRPARVHGWERGWFVAIDNRASGSYACGRCDGLPPQCLVLGIRPAAGESVLGAVIDIEEGDLPAVMARERSYRMEHIRVHDHRASDPSATKAITAVPLAERTAAAGAHIPVPAAYEQAVAEALDTLTVPPGMAVGGEALPAPALRRDDLHYVRGDGVTRGACTCEDA